jgi:hypothetical protein
MNSKPFTLRAGFDSVCTLQLQTLVGSSARIRNHFRVEVATVADVNLT